jgi:DNA processing protein
MRRVGPVDALDVALDGGATSDSLSGSLKARLDRHVLPYTVASARNVAEEALTRAQRLGARVVTPDDDEWPRQVEHLALISRDDGNRLHLDTDPPLCFWVRGGPPLADALDRSAAIVGARAASSYGVHVAAEFAYGLANRDWTVVSGGAFGIDATAHRAAIAAGGLTVAVLACGIDRPYPASHMALFEQIADDGLLITEWPPGSAPHRMRFLTRNRVIAAATRGTIMVEAGIRSGARNTLSHARRLGRPAMVVPGPITSAVSVGCHAELRQPGTTLVSAFDEVIEEIGPIGALAVPPAAPEGPWDGLDTVAKRLLDAVSPRKARSAEEIAAAAGLSGREARRAMPMLEQSGFVVATESGEYRLAVRPNGGAAAP